MARFVPNTNLPTGAKAIKPRRMKLGGYVEMEYDAELVHRGVTFYRVRGGFSHKNDREDWVAQLADGVSTCVCDYNWHDVGFGEYVGTFTQALDRKISDALARAEWDLSAMERKAAKMRESIESLKKAVT